MSNGHFILKKITRFDDIKADTTLPESDLCFQDDRSIYQFKFEKAEEEYKETIMPGIFSLQEANSRIVPKPTEFRNRNLLTSVVNTDSIVAEANTFFQNLHVYEELGEPKARKILIHSEPGMGKTATITHYCLHAVKEDAGTVVLQWPTSQIDSSDILNFLSKYSEYDPACTRLILLMEDIGGGEREGSYGSRAVDSSMLDLLDGLQVTFRLPTFIIATTNYPQNLLSALADRPGRFDLIMALKPPSYEERIKLVEFIAKRDLSDVEKEAFRAKGCELFSVAHLKEAVIRSRLHNKPVPEVVKELIKHRETFKKAFEEKGSVGFGGRYDD